MANPATLLLRQFKAWDANGGPESNRNKSAAQMRGEDWPTHRRTIRYIDSIEQILSEMAELGRNVHIYQQYIPEWTAIVFVWSSSWRQQTSGQIDPQAMQHLETLSDRLDDYVPTVEPNGLSELRDYLDIVRETLKDDPTIPAAMRIHIEQVLNHVVYCVDEYATVGDFDLQAAVERLGATIVRAAGASKNPTHWAKAANTFVWPFMVGTMSSIASASLAQLLPGG